MPKTPDGKKRGARPVKGKAEKSPETPAGMPGPESIVSEETFVSPKGRTYVIRKTNETDPYDPPVKPGGKRDRVG